MPLPDEPGGRRSKILDTEITTREKKKRSREQERFHAKMTGGRRNPGSGADPRLKGDTTREGHTDMGPDALLTECKYTDDDGFRVRADLLQKISLEALEQQKEPALALRIKVPLGIDADWTLIPTRVLAKLLEGYRPSDE